MKPSSSTSCTASSLHDLSPSLSLPEGRASRRARASCSRQPPALTTIHSVGPVAGGDEDDDLDDDAEDQFPDFNLRLDNVESSGYGRNISLTRLSSDDLDAQRLAELKARLEQVKKPLEKTQIREEIRELKKKMHAEGKKV